MKQRPPNRLVNETSPYLLQHAHNPVDWYPWGPEALAKSIQLQRPILLSVGYSACHWCHVMERESFEDPEIANVMNSNFVCIKVDREERPDIDSIYMDAIQAMTGHGGWPMTVFLTPDSEPFYGGTYFPPEPRHGLPSFRQVLESVSDAWKNRRNDAVSQGRRLTELMRSATPKASNEMLSESLVSRGVDRIARGYDPEHGGFGGPPKFPQPPLLELMLRAAVEDIDRRRMVEHTLEAMALGGISDQIGGGFHRYSTDAGWLVPHFEKMLYDNAQLARLYTRAYQAFGHQWLKDTSIGTLGYLQRDLQDEGGCFYTSEDADSEGEEGQFYVWSHDEFMETAPEAAEFYGVTEEGNFEGSNILVASSHERSVNAAQVLLEARSKRTRPGRDEKILTSLNGLAISALAEAGAVFKLPNLIASASTAADFLLQNSRSSNGLSHSYKDGQAKVTGMLEDYAFLADGLYSLWETTFDPRWAADCREICDEMIDRLWDTAEGGFFSTTEAEDLIIRPKEIVESATPSPNAVAARVLFRLGILTGEQSYTSKASDVLRLAHEYMDKAPSATPTYLSTLSFHLSPPPEIVIAGDTAKPETAALIDEVWGTFLPDRVLAGIPPGFSSPLLDGKSEINGSPTAYVCRNYACRRPVNTPEELREQLKANN